MRYAEYMVRPGMAGVLTLPKDAVALGVAMAELLSQPELLAGLAIIDASVNI